MTRLFVRACAPLLLAFATSLRAQVPPLINYQGRVAVGTVNFDGSGQFKFALVNAGTNSAVQAAATPTISNGFFTGATITNGGAGYTVAPAVTISGGSGSGAAAIAIVATAGGGGVVTGVTVTNPGSGYGALAPTVNIAAPPPDFAFVTYWSNDGTSASGSEPAAAVALPVTKGLYSVLLGDAALPAMTVIPESVFNNADVRLRVWFNDGINGSQLLTPDQRLGAVGYALVAGTLQPGGVISASSATISGNVGIGTATPATSLEVNGGVRARGGPPGAYGLNNNGYAFSGNGGDNDSGMFSSSDGLVQFYSDSLERMRITPPGNVGIGTTTPQTALHVAGTVTADRFVSFAAEPAPNVFPVRSMVWIKPGTFIMGSRADEPGRKPDEGPQTVVTLTKGFWMGVHEVTQGEYIAVKSFNPSGFGFPTRPTNPVEQVDWANAVHYGTLLTNTERAAGRIPTNWAYRLPTEAEWEYACRAGPRTTSFGFGDDLSGAIDNYAWYASNSGNSTRVVEQKLANPWGLMDMHGNVWEWCQDFHGPYPGGSLTDPQGPESGLGRVIRGGSWGHSAAECRSAERPWTDAGTRTSMIGFRVVLAPAQP